MNRSIPAHKQTDPAKAPGQIINPINADMMDDMALWGLMHPKQQAGAVHPQRRKEDSEGMTIQRGGSMRHVPADAYKPTHGGYPTPRETELRNRAFNATDAEFKPCRDLPQGWDHV